MRTSRGNRRFARSATSSASVPQFLALESRTLMCAGHGGAALMDLTGVQFQHTGTAGGNGGAPAASTVIVPVHSSKPGAKATIYLDFDGDTGGSWGSYTVTNTPAYTGSSAEMSDIWARVAEKYSPFDVNVTTVNPGSFANGVAVKIVIGGDGAWCGQTAGGLAYVGGFTNGASNTAYIFSENLGAGYPKYVAEAVTHESGHLFGLEHQSRWGESGNGPAAAAVKLDEYFSGDAYRAPSMGNSYGSLRGLWWNGTNSDGVMQDDMAALSGATNGFGYRADDYGNRVSSARKLSVNSAGRFTARGVVSRMTDVDFVKFSIGSSGSVELKLRSIAAGATFDGKLVIYRQNGTILRTVDSSSLGETTTLNLTTGTYYVCVASHGGYGDVGQFTLYGTFTAAAPASAPAGPSAGSNPFGQTSIGSRLVEADELQLG